MGIFSGYNRKFTALKDEDVEKYLDERDRSELSRIIWKMNELRIKDNKSVNAYLVVNIDEPYAPDVVALMKTNGHWSVINDPNQLEAIIADDQLQIPVYEMGD
ncbi:MAG TPA: hypothetical protein IAA29_12000 [Candidatus Paenibacillus intestinavium]|nr:hypothetical protein [Candidatus Paenibacillus intestinavium]